MFKLEKHLSNQHDQHNIMICDYNMQYDWNMLLKRKNKNVNDVNDDHDNLVKTISSDDAICQQHHSLTIDSLS